ncbi:hypothetical protein Bbelb_219480 [Branchiostoma belcheri]|nr:hypothetical protein Bbelb_219480 [Branchiostoma belcheri]
MRAPGKLVRAGSVIAEGQGGESQLSGVHVIPRLPATVSWLYVRHMQMVSGRGQRSSHHVGKTRRGKGMRTTDGLRIADGYISQCRWCQGGINGVESCGSGTGNGVPGAD